MQRRSAGEIIRKLVERINPAIEPSLRVIMPDIYVECIRIALQEGVSAAQRREQISERLCGELEPGLTRELNERVDSSLVPDRWEDDLLKVRRPRSHWCRCSLCASTAANSLCSCDEATPRRGRLRPLCVRHGGWLDHDIETLSTSRALNGAWGTCAGGLEEDHSRVRGVDSRRAGREACARRVRGSRSTCHPVVWTLCGLRTRSRGGPAASWCQSLSRLLMLINLRVARRLKE